MDKIEKHVQQLVDSLHLDDAEILRMFDFTDGEQKLSETDSIRFLQFLRDELAKKSQGSLH